MVTKKYHDINTLHDMTKTLAKNFKKPIKRYKKKKKTRIAAQGRALEQLFLTS